MEFKSLRNIENSFVQIRLYAIVLAVVCLIVVGFSIYKSYDFAKEQREKIYVLDRGKSLMLALSQDASINRPVEAREHVRRFHELFFTLSPEKAAIEGNMQRAFNLSDKTAFDYYKDLLEKGYYSRVISGNIQQRVEVDSIKIDFNAYPYKTLTYATQYIIRSSNLTKRNLITSSQLVSAVRSDNNPQGFIIEKFTVVENKDLEVVKR
ncbi:conjugative transposon protein TraK [Myroides odoratus]|uniref:Conjugative transposon protein TraK n=1 Tax=Myroides odoratus TaxID=256 RepID=A0A9Q6Z4H5_MYROD|nr:conjugative transposon protein TraK [Myroides odoratus]EHQ44309.1 conjugative transposon TraK protein [Myroides odoratus DSM 2801]EKB02588.1 conjugative transposon TraK protein [Myroides odoratus CIP 103059]EKB02993.1 conjugative transposon TraK protein [Myroides odoratus CIP 103059]QQU01584.1 conjugative transposon protein TraK [Myroides odoratus]WQD56137.1 conjugative transposon protein TraK [Myroides odoratus]